MNMTEIQKPLGNRQCLSPSAINTFIQCPSKFLMRDVFKVVVDGEPFIEAEEGIAFHEWCGDYYSLRKKITSDDFMADSNSLDTTFSRNISRAQGLCTREHNIDYLEPVGSEIKVASWDNKRIGYIDRLDRMPDGNYCVVDYKPHDKRKYPSDARRQIHFYISQFNFLIDTKPEFNRRYSGGKATHGLILGYKDASHWYMPYSTRTNNAMEKQIEKIRNTVAFPCKRGPLCDWCDYNGVTCHE